jgi:ankyrin repeat protein
LAKYGENVMKLYHLLLLVLFFGCNSIYGYTSEDLGNAIVNNNVDEVKKILNSTITDKENFPYPLHTAVQYANDSGSLEIIQLFLDKGYDINEKENESGFTPLMMAHNEKIVKYLIAHGANPNIQDNKGQTALFKSITMVGRSQEAKNEINQAFRVLVKHTKDLNQKSVFIITKMTPLLKSIFSNNDEVFFSLIDHGADVSIKDSDGLDTLDYIFKYTDNMKILDYLLDDGYSLEDKKHLLLLASLGSVSGLRINAMESEKLKFIKYTMGKGLKKYINVQDENGNTPLHIAAGAKKPLIVEYYLSQGANPNIKNNEGKTPLDIAVSRNAEDVIKVLKGK